MKNYLYAIVCLLAAITVQGADDLVLAEKGKTGYQIVLPVTSSVPEIGRRLNQAARLIQTAFKTNGFDIQVVPEDKVDLTKPGIYLGDTAFARETGADISRLAGWTYIHKVAGGNLIIAGCDQPDNVKPETNKPHSPGYWLGTLKGTADFLRQYAGARFVYPGETGVEYLKTPRITVPGDMNISKTPVMLYNTCGVSRDLIYDVANNMFPMVGLHFYAHSWPAAVPAEKYRETHPEYFAFVNSNRCCTVKSSDGRWMEQYCISNPEVQELIYQNLIYWLDRGYAMADLGQSDGFQACQCADCKKLFKTGDDWGEKIWIFHRKLAERAAKERPDKRVMILAYGLTRQPPKSFKAFPKNTVIQLVGATPELLAEWNKLEVPGGFTTFTSSYGPYGFAAFTPKITPRKMESTARLFFASHLQGFYKDGGNQLYGLEGPAYYVFGRMLDDPATNRCNDILGEFYSGAFCETAPWMGIFFGTLYHRLEFFAAGTSYVDADGKSRQTLVDPVHYLGCIYTPDFIASLDNVLSQAEKKAYSEKVKRRLALVRLEFDYVKSIATVVHLSNAYQVQPDPASRARLLDALDAFRARVDSYYEKGKKEVIPGWPEMPSLGGLPHGWVNLKAMTYSRYNETVFGWDTKALRDAPLPAPGK